MKLAKFLSNPYTFSESQGLASLFPRLPTSTHSNSQPLAPTLPTNFNACIHHTECLFPINITNLRHFTLLYASLFPFAPLYITLRYFTVFRHIAMRRLQQQLQRTCIIFAINSAFVGTPIFVAPLSRVSTCDSRRLVSDA